EAKQEPKQFSNISNDNLIQSTNVFNEAKQEPKQFSNISNDNLNKIKNILNELKNHYKIDSKDINLISSNYNKNDFIIKNLRYTDTLEVTLSNPREIVDVIVQKINILKNENLTEIKLLLKPRELGEISINLRYKNGELEATITTNNKNITSIINNNIDYLKEKISAIDYKIASVSININTNDKDSENKNKNLYRLTKKTNKPKFELNEEILINNI
ncbi:flagellar hook-length control protein FliK, partial [Thermobrachium celere]|uniref:flagellar hook-length control protein FliK n=1 Tax=Thermobrachium celere TaxID=53422 RepID=UPI001941E51D